MITRQAGAEAKDCLHYEPYLQQVTVGSATSTAPVLPTQEGSPMLWLVETVVWLLIFTAIGFGVVWLVLVLYFSVVD